MRAENPLLQPRWFFKSLARPFKWALAASVVCAALVIFLPNHFKSTARVLPGSDRQLPGLGQVAALAPMLGISGLGSSDDAIYTEVLGSWWLHRRLLETSFRFHERSWRFGAEAERTCTWRDYLRRKTLDESIQSSMEHMKVRKDVKTRVITIDVETLSPDLSQALVRRTLELLDEFLREKTRTKGGSKARFAEARLKEAEKELTAAEDAMKKWFQAGHANYLTSADPTVRLEGAHLEGMLAMRKQAVLTLAALKEQALLEEKTDIPVLSILDDGNLPERKSRPTRSLMVMAVFALAFLGAWLKDNHPVVRAFLAPGTSA